MRRGLSSCLCLSLAFLIQLAAGDLSGQEAAESRTDNARQSDPSAVEAIGAVVERLASSKTLTAVAEVAYDVVQEDGLRLEFGGRATLQLRRPGRFASRWQPRQGSVRHASFDGRRFTVWDEQAAVYAQFELEGTLDEALDYLADDLGHEIVLSDLFRRSLPDLFAQGIEAADLVADLGSSTLFERETRHVAARRPGLDTQLWISEGPTGPELTRLALTYSDAPAQPQFRAYFLSWSFDTPIADGEELALAPPAEYRKIRFETPRWKTAQEGE